MRYPTFDYYTYRRSNPTQGSIHTLVDGIKGKGQYVGTYLAWRVNDNCWWGEGEIKFYMDGDKEYPTICGTGTEDYFCGSYNFENQKTHQYQEFTTPSSGTVIVRGEELAKKNDEQPQTRRPPRRNLRRQGRG